MKNRPVLAAILGVVALCSIAFVHGSIAAPKATTATTPAPASVTIAGMPGNGLVPFPSLTLTVAQLAALPQTTITVPVGGVMKTEKGPLVSSLLTQAGFAPIAACTNDILRYWTEVSSLNGSAVQIANGELNTGFGNRPAILSIEENGVPLTIPRLAVPNDSSGARNIANVFNITVGRAAPQIAAANASCNPAGFTPPVTAPAAPSVLVNGDVAHPATFSLAQLQGMPQVTQDVSFQSGANTRSNREQGPTVFDVASAAQPNFRTGDPSDYLRWYVQGTSTQDGVPAVISWAEIQPLLIDTQSLLALVETPLPSPPGVATPQSSGPRLTAPGDVRGGRYITGIGVVSIFRAPDIVPSVGSGASMAGQNLSGQSLQSGFFVSANLSGSNLGGAQAQGAFFNGANLSGANLSGANLTGAMLIGANLTGANLGGANLTGADLTGATTAGASLGGATWSNTTCPDGTNSNAHGNTCAGHL